MKQTPELDAVQARMRAGEMTLKGFLGEDARPLADILAEDDRTVRGRGFAHETIADRLADLTERGRDIGERDIVVDGRWTVRVRDDRGVIPSPFGDGLFGKGEVEMTDASTGRRLRWNGLCIHMIRAHGFYGGRGSEYRLEPADLPEALGLAPRRADG